MTTDEQKEKAWNKSKPIPRKDPNLYRLDDFGNEIYKPSFGKEGSKSWEIDHVKPLSKGGTDSTRNIRALQTKANREKGDKYPYKP